jgi:O-acetyl-ADP-ribose deacetylase (regulator of RNase III)
MLSIERLILVDPDPAVVDAWRVHFEDEPGVEVRHGRFEDLGEFDCIVSAANSFGLMDGGVDLAILRFFGIELMDRVQAQLVDRFFGEQPVGTSMLVETGMKKHPFVAHTPTMRIPRDVRGTDAVYNAMLAMLREVELHNRASGTLRRIRIVACPGLGTLTGRMPPNEAARQMHMGWQSMRFPLTEITWPAAQTRDRNVRWRDAAE